jgi:hypothetical protein
MMYGIIKMHYQPWAPCSSPAAHDLRKWLKSFFAEVATLEFFPGSEPFDYDGAVDT